METHQFRIIKTNSLQSFKGIHLNSPLNLYTDTHITTTTTTIIFNKVNLSNLVKSVANIFFNLYLHIKINLKI